MAIDFSQLRWSSLGHTIYEVVNRNDFYSLKLKGTSKKLFRIDWKHNNYNDHTRLVGYLHGTVDIFGAEATIIHQKITLGTNIIIIPENIEYISSFYLNHYKAYGGKFTVQYFEPTIQVVINPITNQPVILGQESLNLIEGINQNYSDQIIEELTKKITIQLSQELKNIEYQVGNITTILSGGII